MNRFNEFVRISRFAGQRYDLVQAGGGNTSVKNPDSSMTIKASGCWLGDVSEAIGHVTVDNTQILHIIEQEHLNPLLRSPERDRHIARQIDRSVIRGSGRPSIEIFLHALLDTYTLHTHPLAVCALTIIKKWRERMLLLEPDALCVEYTTPGIQLALTLDRALREYQTARMKLPSVVFLQNHGMIVSSATIDDVIEITERIVGRSEQILGVDLSLYKQVTKLNRLLSAIGVTDIVIHQSLRGDLLQSLKTHRSVFTKPPFYPDMLVYCGFAAVEISSFNDTESIKQYIGAHQEYPKVIICGENIFFVASNIQKAREIEDVFAAHVGVLRLIDEDINYLPEQELKYLNNWEAEQFRRKL